LIFALYEHREGVEIRGGSQVVYDLERNDAHFGAVRVDGPALVWCLARDRDALATDCYKGSGRAPALRAEVGIGEEDGWVLRCDRIDFPPGGVAYRHVHPGPGIRRLLFGELTIDRGDGEARTYRAREAWFEGADDPVVATASATEETAFVRVLLLPAEWAGKRTIRYLDPADEKRPTLQRATILLEEPIEL
jgi:quercetin dioxygenase-like cupin family protein